MKFYLTESQGADSVTIRRCRVIGTTEIEVDTLDNILEALGIDTDKIALISTGFAITGTRGSCYFPGDISYYQPFKWLITHFLGIARFLEKTLSGRQPFKLLGYGIVVSCSK